MTAELTLKLFVSGEPDDFQVMRAGIESLLSSPAGPPHRLDIIDVLMQPEQADQARVLMTPTLLLRSGDRERRLVGNPAEAVRLRQLIADLQGP